jgi:Subunit ChlI of Mg-chelatase
MSLAVLYSRALAGMDAPPVTVEAHLANGLPSFTIVGLPEAEVKEAKDRVRAALQNARFEFPARRITVNLAPADLPKESCRLRSASSRPPGRSRRTGCGIMNSSASSRSPGSCGRCAARSP